MISTGKTKIMIHFIRRTSLIFVFIQICAVLFAADRNYVMPDTGEPVYSELSESIYRGFVPRVELLAGVLSHTGWMDRRGPDGEGNRYFRELHDFFEPYKNHDAVKLAEKLTKKGFTYDAPPNFIISLSPLPDLDVRNGYSDYLIERARGADKLEDFRLALIDLAEKSDFLSFFNSHRENYKRWEENTFRDFDGQLISGWLEGFFGWKGEEFHLILAPSMFPQGGYGASYALDNKLIAVQITREHGRSADEPEFGDGHSLEFLALHELGHAYVNPSLEHEQGLLEEYGLKELYTPVKDIMKKQAYGDYLIFLNESVLRAVTCVALAELTDDPSLITIISSREKERGFYLQDFLVAEIMNYEKSRETYKTFKEFVPFLLRRMNDEKKDLLQLH